MVRIRAFLRFKQIDVEMPTWMIVQQATSEFVYKFWVICHVSSMSRDKTNDHITTFFTSRWHSFPNGLLMFILFTFKWRPFYYSMDAHLLQLDANFDHFFSILFFTLSSKRKYSRKANLIYVINWLYMCVCVLSVRVYMFVFVFMLMFVLVW